MWTHALTDTCLWFFAGFRLWDLWEHPIDQFHVTSCQKKCPWRNDLYIVSAGSLGDRGKTKTKMLKTRFPNFTDFLVSLDPDEFQKQEWITLSYPNALFATAVSGIAIGPPGARSGPPLTEPPGPPGKTRDDRSPGGLYFVTHPGVSAHVVFIFKTDVVFSKILPIRSGIINVIFQR